jgi:hypothetical protein
MNERAESDIIPIHSTEDEEMCTLFTETQQIDSTETTITETELDQPLDETTPFEDQFNSESLAQSSGTNPGKWGKIKHLPPGDWEPILKKYLSNGENTEFTPIYQDGGSFNQAFIIARCSDGSKYILRIPACGQKDHWTEADAQNLQIKALGMKYLKRKAGIRVPDIIAWNNSLDNSLLGIPLSS